MSYHDDKNWKMMREYHDAILHLQNLQHNLVDIIEDFMKGRNLDDVKQRAGFLLEGVSQDYVTGLGQVLSNVHHPSTCEGRDCVIHNPSIHNMVGWPTRFTDSKIMERVCRHGVGHPDPDDPYVTEDYVHDCCGCCE